MGAGIVSIRNKAGEEKCHIERPDGAPIWALSWNPNKEDPSDTLCVTDWNKTLTFYTLGGKIIGKERNIGFDALKVNYFSSGQYILICGTNKCCNLYTKDGIKLGMIGDQQNSWVWCNASHPSGDYIVMGCQDGTLIYYQLVFNTVHGLFKERYAFRESMTDVIIQHLLTEKKVKIKCRDLIKKIAIYKNRLAVQLSERVVIYELFSADVNGLHYRVKEKITQKLDCSLLVICSEHLVVCKDKKLQSMSLTGVKDKEWEFDSTIRYIKVVGGPPSKEGLIAGLKNGQIWKIYLDNSFPLLILSVHAAVRCLDMTESKDKISVVDETGL
ncbi:intraflagellar transport protein 122 homolog, partial [Agrilus planipennis]